MGCGGEDSYGTNNTQGNTQLNADQTAFSSTLYPILSSHCSTCHSEVNTSANAPKFAHSDVVQAYTVVTSKNLVNRNNPTDSKLVNRLAVDKHNCWSTCLENSNEVAGAISQWNKLAAASGSTGGTTIPGNGNAGQTSVQAFSQSLQPVLTQWCGTCHNGSLVYSPFASDDAKSSHDEILNKNLVDLQNPANSVLVSYLNVKQHNCWSDCATNATATTAKIALWK